MLTSALPAALTPIATLGPSWLDPAHMISAFVNWVGPWSVLGVFLVVFAETGLLIGFFLPGDSLLFTLGMFVAVGEHSQGAEGVHVPLWITCIVIFMGAFLGDQTGYWIGRKTGPRVFDKPDSRLFKKEYVDKTNRYFARFGGRTVILARFVPIVRTFAPVAAGVGKMNHRTFTLFSVIGNTLWAPVCICLGYWLGRYDFVQKNIDLIIIGVVALSVAPMIIHAIRKRIQAMRNRGGAGAPAAPEGASTDEATQGTDLTESAAASVQDTEMRSAATAVMPAQPAAPLAPPQPPARSATPGQH